MEGENSERRDIINKMDNLNCNVLYRINIVSSWQRPCYRRMVARPINRRWLYYIPVEKRKKLQLARRAKKLLKLEFPIGLKFAKLAFAVHE